MNYIELIENEVEVPAIYMKDVKKRCRDCQSSFYLKNQWEFVQRLKTWCANRGDGATREV